MTNIQYALHKILQPLLRAISQVHGPKCHLREKHKLALHGCDNPVFLASKLQHNFTSAITQCILACQAGGSHSREKALLNFPRKY